MPSNWLLFDRIRALTRQYSVFPSEKIFQDQSQLDRLTSGGQFHYNQPAMILDQTNVQINRLERYRDYELMDQTGEISLALDLYADEGSLCDPETKHCLIIKARNRRLKRELEDFYFGILQWDTLCRPTMRYLCKYGDFPAEIVPNENRDGISALRFMNVYNFTRIETRFGDLVGFFYQDLLHQQPLFLHPWQVMHLRLTSFENIYAPYGKAILDGGRKAWKQLRLMEDAALIYRITRAPERRKFTIPVGMIPPKEVPEYLQMVARNFKRQRFYNPATGSFDERYSPLIQEDDFMLPRRPDGTGPDVDTLPGAENLDQIADIEYFKKKMISPMKIPFARVGIGEGAGEANEKSLSQSSSEFAKAVQWVQREASSGLTKAGIVHLALRGYSAEDLKGFSLALPSTSAMEELYRIETWQTRTSVMMNLKELGWFPKEWIVTHFTDLSPDEIEELKEMETVEANGGPGGGQPGGLELGAPAPTDDSMGTDLSATDNPLEDLAAGKPTEPEDELKLEGYDYAAEQRLLRQLKEQDRRADALKLIKRWADRLGKSERTPIEHTNGYSYLLEMKELDGLTTAVLPASSGLSIPDPNQANGLLVEWSVEHQERDHAILATYKILTESMPEDEIDDDEITSADLPDLD